MAWEDRVAIVRRHFEKKGYRVHSGLQFGCELVLYADDPSRVHSDFCVHVVRPGKGGEHVACHDVVITLTQRQQMNDLIGESCKLWCDPCLIYTRL